MSHLRATDGSIKSGSDAMVNENDIEWANTVTLQFTDGSKLEILRREVPDAEVFNEDIAPYRAISSWWFQGGKNEAAVTGLLRRFKYSSIGDTFEVSSPILRAAVLGVLHVQTRTLTVWRVNDALDALQIRIEGESGYVYARLVGERFGRMFRRLSASARSEDIEGLAVASRLFAAAEPPASTYRFYA